MQRTDRSQEPLLYVCVCIYVYVCVCVYVRMYVCMYV
jgi:hypothetical protein